MKSKAIESERRNIFGIIKDSVFGSIADFFKTLSSTEIDDSQEEMETPDMKAEVASVARTPLDSDDVIEVEAGKTAKFGGLDSYKRKVDVGKAVKQHSEKAKTNSGEEIEKEGSSRNRGAR